MSAEKKYGFTTSVLHSDRSKPIEHGSLHRPVHTSATFSYASASELAAVFQGKQPGYRYARQGNPTVGALEDKINRMEDGVATTCFSSGMAAIGSLFQALLKAGDHVVSSVFLFGNTRYQWNTIAGLGVDVDFVDATDVSQVEKALRPTTRIVFVETIANPRTQIADLEKIGRLCQEKGILLAVDNTMTSPWLFRPKSIGAALSINSLTKFIGGHGNAMGGSVTDTGVFDWARYPNIAEGFKKLPASQRGNAQIRAKALRDFGACLGPESAHHIAVGAETLALRMERSCANALALAKMLETEKAVTAVYYPGLSSHPQHDLASRLFSGFGGMLSFEIDEKVDLFACLNRLKIGIFASNLGDTRTLVNPVAHTIYYDMSDAAKKEQGIASSLVRVSVGIEDTQDILDDFHQALSF
ncbi:cystathionine gamma-synthase family protein [Oxalobacter vibrioformis]|uniref:Cystathionine gamma-synthase family protein n=1 Tax=Oxalobacter vibrioformis TaxID=933080 RepID=A0A9E9LWY6_9BURK|nr:cystathionine gamma-synthase family protein [Oxalobacter vibrioformis]WAW10791.1 cystathionine gamma-synthase family protein [Oxalobacter vibrioformis]